MEIIRINEFEGLCLIDTKIYQDDRGFFVEKFNRDIFLELGLPIDFFQDNHSFSLPKVIRGLHYQIPHQTKIISCVRGSILDVVVDLRKDSKSFGKHFATELSSKNGKMIFVPPGFAHGFCVLGDEPADVFYKVDKKYNKNTENGIIYNDPDLAINWPIKNPILSIKDKNLQSFKDYVNNL